MESLPPMCTICAFFTALRIVFLMAWTATACWKMTSHRDEEKGFCPFVTDHQAFNLKHITVLLTIHSIYLYIYCIVYFMCVYMLYISISIYIYTYIKIDIDIDKYVYIYLKNNNNNISTTKSKTAALAKAVGNVSTACVNSNFHSLVGDFGSLDSKL